MQLFFQAKEKWIESTSPMGEVRLVWQKQMNFFKIVLCLAKYFEGEFCYA